MAQLTVLNGFITIYNLGYGAYISIYNCSWPIAITLGKGIAVGSQVRIPGKVWNVAGKMLLSPLKHGFFYSNHGFFYSNHLFKNNLFLWRMSGMSNCYVWAIQRLSWFIDGGSTIPIQKPCSAGKAPSETLKIQRYESFLLFNMGH